LRLCHFDVSFKLLNEAVFIAHFLLEVTVVFLQLAHDEAFRKVVAHLVYSLSRWSTIASIVWLSQGLLKSDRQLLKFFVARVELLLDLLELCFEFDVLVFGVIISYLEVSILVLKVFFGHFNKEPLICRSLVLVSKDHFSSQLFAFEVVKCLRWTSIATLRNLIRGVSPRALRDDISLEGLVLLHGILLLELRVDHVVLLGILWILVWVNTLRELRTILLLLAIWLLLLLVSRVSVGISLRSLTLASHCLSLLHLLGQRTILAVILVIDHEDCLIVCICCIICISSVLAGNVHDLLFNVVLVFILVYDFFIVAFNVLLIVFQFLVVHVFITLQVFIFFFVIVVRQSIPSSNCRLLLIIIFANDLLDFFVHEVVLNVSIGCKCHIHIAFLDLFFLIRVAYKGIIDVLFVNVVHICLFL